MIEDSCRAGKRRSPRQFRRNHPTIEQGCLRRDRRSSYDQWSLDLPDALAHETQLGLETIRSGETRDGAARFAQGEGRHGTPA